MNSQRLGLRVAAFLFTLFTIAHVVRLVRHTEVMLGSVVVPWWISGVAIIVAGSLSVWFWSLSKK